MNATTDFERTLATWLEADGPADVPERVITAAFAEARTVHQRQAWLASTWWATRTSRKDGAMKRIPRIDRDPGPTVGGSLRLVWIVALVGLLAAAALGAAVIGGALIRQSDELSLVSPLPSATTSPSAATPSATPLITSSAFGPITWRTLDPSDVPQADDIRVTGTRYGLVAMTDDGLRWLAPDGNWTVMPFEGSSILTPVFAVGDDLLVGRPAPVWLRRSGPTWVVGEEIEIQAVLDATAHVAAGPQGIVVTSGAYVSIGSPLYHSKDGLHFARAEQPPDEAKLSGRVGECDPWMSLEAYGGVGFGPLIATDEGFVVLSQAAPQDATKEPICEPVLWFSADGSSWDLVSPISPFGPGAYVLEVASREGRHVAIGGDAELPLMSTVVWVSDDGLTWDRLPPLPTSDCPSCHSWLSRVAAGEPGWVILSAQGDAWTSTDGRTWQVLNGWPQIPDGGWGLQDLALSPGSVYVASAIRTEGIVLGTFEP